MAEKKELRIGLIGYGFMGRTHTNGYKRVSDFFPDLGHTPVLQAVCGRTEDRTKAFADQWGYASYETDWRELIKGTTSTPSTSALPMTNTQKSP